MFRSFVSKLQTKREQHDYELEDFNYCCYYYCYSSFWVLDRCQHSRRKKRRMNQINYDSNLSMDESIPFLLLLLSFDVCIDLNHRSLLRMFQIILSLKMMILHETNEWLLWRMDLCLQFFGVVCSWMWM